MRSPAFAAIVSVALVLLSGCSSPHDRPASDTRPLETIAPPAPASTSRQSDPDIQQKLRDRATRLRAAVGKSWTVTLPNGKSDVWNVTRVNDMGITDMKDGSQRELTVIVADSGTVTVMVDDCVLTGKMTGTTVTGTASASCPLGAGDWNATIRGDR